MKKIKKNDINLYDTITCGQIFRFIVRDNEYILILSDRVVKLTEDDDYIYINSSNEVINVAKRMTGEEKSFRVREMYNKDSLTNPIYLVYGISETKQNGKEVYALVYVDNQYSTFAIEPITKTKYENYLTEKTEITPIDIIAKNNFNQYTKTALEDEDINEKYFDTIIREMLYHPEYAYTRLDSEYQKARFTTMIASKNILMIINRN